MINKETADLSVLLVTLVATPAFCYSMYRNPQLSQKKGFLFLLSFLAMYPFLNMLGHIIAISYVNYLSAQDGTFYYHFRFYSLMLYGVLFMLINGYTLSCIRDLSRGDWRVYKPIVRINLLQIILILPSFPLNPLALLPAMTSLALIIRLVAAKHKKDNRQAEQIFTEPNAELV